MRKYPILKNLIVLTIIFLIIFGLIDGFRNGNTLGIVLAIASLVAFIVTGRMLTRLSKAKAASELKEEGETTA